MRHLQFQHHDRDNDRDHAVAKCLQSPCTHLVFLCTPGKQASRPPHLRPATVAIWFPFGSIRRNTLSDPATDSAAAIHNSARYPPTKDSAIALRASEFAVCIAASLGLWKSIC